MLRADQDEVELRQVEVNDLRNRCAGVKERGTCDNIISVRKGALEEDVLSVLQCHLLTPELTEVFVGEFKREVARLTQNSDQRTATDAQRLAVIARQSEALAENMLVSSASPTLHRMLTELEREKADIEAICAPVSAPKRDIPPYRTLVELFQEKVGSSKHR